MRGILLWIFLSLFILVGCQTTHLPTSARSKFPQNLSDEELERLSRCEFWQVCQFLDQEELEPFGPNFLHEGKPLYQTRQTCYFQDCDRLERFRKRRP